MTDSTDNARALGPWQAFPAASTDNARGPERIWAAECRQTHSTMWWPDDAGGVGTEYIRADLAAPSPDVLALVEASGELSSIVEGIQGAFNHGTWRDEKNGMRLKDTNEWVTFYVALASITDTGEPT